MDALTVPPQMAEALLAATAKWGTPLYLYDMDNVSARCAAFSAAFEGVERIHKLFAMKANSNRDIVTAIVQAGWHLECVSEGEVLYAARVFESLGVRGRALFTNNNVHADEFTRVASLRHPHMDVWVNIDSMDRLELLPRGSDCFLRINGGVGGGHHAHVITCGPDSKFGVPRAHVARALAIAASRELRVIGLHQHIGSGISDVDTYMTAFEVLASVIREHAPSLPHLAYADFGGGVGVSYALDAPGMDLPACGARVRDAFNALQRECGRTLTLLLEPGRYPVASAGMLLTRVNSIKAAPEREGGERTWVGVDTGFNHLVRPTMYGSYHHMTLLPTTDTTAATGDAAQQRVYVAGNVCESGDVFTRSRDGEGGIGDRLLPPVHAGDVLVMHTTGAYGYSMSSEYNMRPRPAEVCMRRAKGGAEEESMLAGRECMRVGDYVLWLSRPAKTVVQLVEEAFEMR